MKTMRATFNGLRRDLTEGRQWKVKSERSGNTYIVTFYAHDGHRMGFCSCPAGSRDMFCRHLPFAAGCDSQLTKAPLAVAA
jgi:hypothetical protein